ncbi:hypothetical protein MBLNU459_g5509t1 [Dothideomycetes sp. NU459]
MKKPTNVPKTQAAPAVPSFGAPLLPQVSAAATPASKGTIGKKKLGLIPQDYDSDESEHDVDEEAAFVDRQSEPLTFEFNGELATLNSSADIAAWIEERKKRWPSKRRIEEKKEEVQKRMQERRRIEEETRAAATKSSSTHDASLGRIALPPHKQKQPKPRNPEARIKETTLDETRKELEKQMQKVEDLQRLLAQSESRAAAAAKSVRDESGGTDESSNEVPRSAEETNNGQDVTQSLITALEESQHELCVSRVEERSNDSGLGPTEGLQTDAHSDQKGRHGDTVLAPEHVAGESQCQAQAWKRVHKQECKILKDLPPLPSAVRATLQLALKMTSSSSLCTEEDKRDVRRLQHHDIDFFDQQEYATTAQASRNIIEGHLPELFGTGLVDVFSGQIWRNSLTLVSETLDPMGLVFDPLLCTANHSCSPNAYILFVGPTVCMRSLVPISKDEEICISYVDTTNPYAVRQAELSERYHFQCQCKKCGLGPSQKEDEFLRPTAELESTRKDALMTLQTQAFRKLEDAQKNNKPSLAVKRLQSVLDTCAASGMWPITRQPYAVARNELFANLCAIGNASTALLHATKTYFLIDPILFPQRAHPVRVVHTWALVKALMWVYQDCSDAATHAKYNHFMDVQQFDFVVPIWRLLKEVQSLVLRSHGQMSRLTHTIHQTAEDVKAEIVRNGAQNLALVESDPGGYWKVFRSWADKLA